MPTLTNFEGWKEAVAANYVIAQHLNGLGSHGIHSEDFAALERVQAVLEALERVMDCLGE
jgi:hypothetical protein